MFSKFLQIVGLGVILTLSSQAYATFNDPTDDLNWSISIDGETTEVTSLQFESAAATVITGLDNNGLPNSFRNYGILTTKTGFGAFEGGPAVVTKLFSGDFALTAVYDDWEGTLDVNGATNEADIIITSGTMKWYLTPDGGTPELIMTTQVVQGSGDLDLVPNGEGTVQLVLKVISAEPGYFGLDINNNGQYEDFADLVGDETKLYVGYGVTNNSIAEFPDQNITDDQIKQVLVAAIQNHLLTPAAQALVDAADADNNSILTDAEIATIDRDALINALYDPNLGLLGNPLFFTTTSTGGAGSLTFSAIPEPGMIGLMGLALFGLAGLQRRRKTQ